MRKSSLLRAWVEKHNFCKSDLVFLNFEDPRLADSLDHRLLTRILEVSLTRNSGKLPVLCFDEILEVEKWEKWIHSFLERSPTAKLVITGFNASLLLGELASKLTGKYQKIELFPFLLPEARVKEPKLSWQDFLERGGFPKVFLEGNANLLRNYFDDIILKDSVRRFSLRDPQVLRKLAKVLF